MILILIVISIFGCNDLKIDIIKMKIICQEIFGERSACATAQKSGTAGYIIVHQFQLQHCLHEKIVYFGSQLQSAFWRVIAY